MSMMLNLFTAPPPPGRALVKMRKSFLVNVDDDKEMEHNVTTETDPFENDLHLTCCQKIKAFAVGIVCVPLKILTFLITGLFLWILALAVSCGVSEEDLGNVPFTGWRLCLQNVGYCLARILFLAMGVVHVKYKGKVRQVIQGTGNNCPSLI